MPNSLALVLMGLVEMAVGYSIYRYGPAEVRKMQAMIIDEAERRDWGGFFRVMAQWQLFIAKLGGALFFGGGVVTLVTGLLGALNVIDLG
ncbi:MAG TPA: hypothetical protein VK464_24435 [Symbiobacteriaceae bacterium]|nr:hypothetical protein [Symbiobacteriaceae bacterium]